MDWNKTKSMFIIVFLILDIFLLTQLINQYRENKLQSINDPSKEEMLKNANITYKILSSGTVEGQYVSAKTKEFKESDLKGLKGQTAQIINSTTLSSSFDKPIKIKGELDPAQLESILKEKILYGDQYKFWSYDKDQNKIIFSQTFEGKLFYNNKNGQVLLYLDGKGNIISYEQTILENMEKKEGDEVIPEIDAIVTLYEKGMLPSNSQIVGELGYYTLVQQTELQMLVPTWHFVVEHGDTKEHLYVNAIDKSVYTMDDKEKQIME